MRYKFVLQRSKCTQERKCETIAERSQLATLAPIIQGDPNCVAIIRRFDVIIIIKIQTVAKCFVKWRTSSACNCLCVFDEINSDNATLILMAYERCDFYSLYITYFSVFCTACTQLGTFATSHEIKVHLTKTTLSKECIYILPSMPIS